MKARVIVEAFAYISLIALIMFMPSVLSSLFKTSIPLAVVTSTSMRPTLDVGDIVLIEGVNPEDVKPGDIIVFKDLVYEPGGHVIVRDTPIIHRVVRVVYDDGNIYFKTKGDNNAREDAWLVPGDRVLGKVIEISNTPFKIPFIGMLSLLIHNVRMS